MIPRPIRTACCWCSVQLVFVPGAGWEHTAGGFVATYRGPNGELRDSHVATPDMDALEDERAPNGGVFAEGVKA